MCYVLCMLEAVEGGLYSLEVLRGAGSDAPSAARCVGGRGGWALFAGSAGGAGDTGGDALRATLFAIGVGGVGEAMHCVLLFAGGTDRARGDVLCATLHTGGCGGWALFAGGCGGARGDGDDRGAGGAFFECQGGRVERDEQRGRRIYGLRCLPQ